jgi:hypothetical protein
MGFQLDSLLVDCGAGPRQPPREVFVTAPATSAPQLAAVAVHLLARMSEAAVADMQARYDLGQVVHRLRYGEECAARRDHIALLASSFDIHPSALRRMARVSESVSPGEFRYFCALRDSRGIPLTWSHLEVLSEIRYAPRRRELADLASARRLSVRELRGLVAKRKPSSGMSAP